ncbi:P-type E1-E2 ATPase [Methanothermobacter defluvii]|uniref:P-type E1-E2 ATPase n=1 Tax=Methanothermobacter defluvii TaxID=49339 RepID=A0A371NBK6_9EURY|nr:cation-transporting P-type ATPase [Methanothermobacter defluvii]REE26423.1 P-type E1-E2 ATPase [Methanothermobacter defluvii]
MTAIYELEVEEVLQRLETSESGLDPQEAEKRLKIHGPNKLEEVKRRPLILLFLSNLYNVLALLLWIAAILSFITGNYQLAVAIVMVIIINALFSFWQEYEAEKAAEALKNILPVMVKVIRASKEVLIPAADVVHGDIIILEEGDTVPADARILESHNLRVDASALTGESKPVRKVSHPVREADNYIDTENILFAGTQVTSGTGRAAVFATGRDTEFSRIATLTQEVREEPSPLQRQISLAARIIGALAVAMGVILFLVNLYIVRLPLETAFIFAIGLMVANVPEGLLPSVTLSLAASARKMARENALVKRLSSVETLGSTTIICTDKTGTLTRGEMTVRKIWIPHKVIEVTGSGYRPEGQFLFRGEPVSHRDMAELKLLMRAATFCNDSALIHEEGEWSVLGDSTEGALLVAAEKLGFDAEAELKAMPRITELPFDSRRKSMTSIHEKSGKRVAYVKGAPKKIIGLSERISVDGRVRALHADEKERIIGIHDEMASKGLRVLAFAYRELPEDLEVRDPGEVERDLVLVGMAAMHDPPREGVKEAVEHCKTAGIRIIMITGDYGLTAEAIAREIGIVEGECRIIKGKELDKLKDTELRGILARERNLIFARAVPEHKMRIASVLEDSDEIVAMTGDGVNDAPALRKADIGVAMGSGTDVAKEAADIVLADDNFASIVTAVREGRTVYENIRKFITYIFSHETAEIVPFIMMVLFSIPLPITIMQILAIDLGTDTLPALALGRSPPESDVMKLPPRPPSERLLNREVILRGYLFTGTIEAALIMAAYFLVLYSGGWLPGQELSASDPLYMRATTAVFAGIVMAQLGNLLSSQTLRSSALEVGLLRNRWIPAGMVFAISVMLLVIYLPPLQPIFGTSPPGIREWFILILFTPIVFLTDEMRKFIQRRLA